MMALRIVVALSKDTASDESVNKADIGEMAYNVDELVSENGISDDGASKAGDLIDDEAESKTDRKRRNRKIRTPYGDSDDVKDEEWIDWY